MLGKNTLSINKSSSKIILMLWGLVLDHLLSAHMFLIRKKVIKKYRNSCSPLMSNLLHPTVELSSTLRAKK